MKTRRARHIREGIMLGREMVAAYKGYGWGASSRGKRYASDSPRDKAVKAAFRRTWQRLEAIS